MSTADVSSLSAEIRVATGLKVDRCRDLGGSFTTNLALETPAGSLVARVHPVTTSRERVAAEQAARRVLAEAGVPAVTPLALLALPGGRHLELEPYVEAREPMKTPSRLIAGYRVLARLHDILDAASLPPAADVVVWSNHVHARDALTVTESAVKTLVADCGQDLTNFADALLAHVRDVAALEAELVGCSPAQLTHGDFWDGNVLLDRGEVAAVLDLGFMAVRPRIDDLALPFWFWLLEPGHGLPTGDDIEFLARLADAYDDGARVPLTEQERAALPLAVARQPAWAAHHWRADPRPGVAPVLARRAVDELPVARSVMARLPEWRRALARSAA